MFIGPHVKRGYVSRTLTDFGSVMRLIFTTLGMPPLNQFDAAASLPLDVFTGKADATPYRGAARRSRGCSIPQAAFKPFDRRFNWRRTGGSRWKSTIPRTCGGRLPIRRRAGEGRGR